MPELPLFPLNTVLFPGMQLKLHIFEDRYKSMISRCIEQDMPFGVVLISSGIEAQGPVAIPHEVGCSAKIIEVQRLPFERINIIAVGHRRFHIRDVDNSNPYLIGDVQFFTPEIDDREKTGQHAGSLRPLIIRYLEILATAEEIDFDPDQIPRSPKSLAQVACILLQADNMQKQELLCQEKLSRLMSLLVDIYRLETLLLNVRLSPPKEDFNIGPFSSN